MPIANCYLNETGVSNKQLDDLTKEWSQMIQVDLKDITISCVEVSSQSGQKYKVMVNLFLPTLWDKATAAKIQLSLDALLKRHLKLQNEDVFIITHLIQSGNVIENGRLAQWD